MSDAMTTDLYEVTMAMSYLREGMTAPATFSLFVRDLPPERGFLVAAGLESALDYLSGLHVGPEDVDAFASALHRPPGDVQALLGLEFTGDVRAVPEGRIVRAGEPLLEVTAPLPQAQLAETYVLNQVSHQTALASKAARCMLAAAGHPVVDFSLRRTHGPQSGFQAARLGAMVGFAGTSNVAAATAVGIPAVGTMAHSFVEAFATEESAFRAFARSHPGPVTLLVDTYDTEDGVHVAARVLRDLDRGPGSAVRLDSSDLGTLAVRARDILDGAGLPDVRIVASGGLDEYALDELVRSGAPIDTYAVGTRVGVSADAPFLDSAYKMVEYDGRPVMKLSTAKVTAPGPKQVFRRPGYADVIGLADEKPPADGRPLLETVMRGGRRTGDRSTLDECRARFATDLDGLPSAARRIRGPQAPRATVSERLSVLTARVRHRVEELARAPAAQPPDAERTASGSHRCVTR
ncbi:nicotinate phosphoribosyltransferase [Streptomyces cyaneochromogenes]|uniref:Nicotinate phosphoribosyltransferase n=1 Tax=Streptomyces cyaneochromogenes TaxID=2496836 RepID=A0A3S9MJU5_9ACTN|nr:nicotinate phosphoribosyltransferase [Streptomyces cyaneochromogenes]AZQ39433.1 nicotinate phosphoribosyltransferase [Streptomyces cyaneochromogenes]